MAKAAAPGKRKGKKKDRAARFGLALDCFAMPERMKEREREVCQLVRIEKEVGKMFGLVK